ncbi:hypothetical protein SRABI106_04716 [Rahnella aquatilis]|nr:hypothetical protein SRABI106_04716 [Rahnella aquatilis]
MNTAVAQNVQHQLQTALLCRVDTGVEVFGADQFTQSKVAFKAGARRTDTDSFLRLTNNICRALHRLFSVKFDPVVTTQLQWFLRTIFQVHVAITETTAVAQEVMVYGTVITVFDTTQFAVTLTRAGVTTNRTLLTDAWRKLHVPFTVITFRVRFIGEYAGRTHFDQVTGELAFQRTIVRTAKIDVVVCAINTQIGAVRVILGVTDTAITGDTAVDFV